MSRRTSAFARSILALAVLGAPVATSLTAEHAAHAASPGDTSRRLQEAAAAVDSARGFLAKKEDGRAKKRLAEAESIFRDVLRLEKDHREATLGLSAVLFLQRRHDDGVALLEPFHERAPDDLDMVHQLGLHVYRAGQQQRGLELLGRAAEHPKRFDAIWVLVQHHYNNGDYAAGLPYAERYANARPDDVDALALIGTYYLKSARFEQAVGAFDRYLDANPDNTSVVLNRANALFRSERYEEAGAVYATLLAKTPNNNRYLYNLASVRVRQERCEEAIELLDRLLSREPTFGPALYFRADCLRRIGDLERAEAAYLKAGEDGQSNPWIHYGLSQVEWRRGNAEAARQRAERALELGPNEAELHAWLGTLLRREGRAEAGLVRHDMAMELAPDAVSYRVERGFDLFRLSRWAEAAAAFEGALDAAPSDSNAKRGAVAALLSLARSLEAEGRTADARAAAEKALALAPESGRARAFAGLLALRGGQKDAAKAALSPGNPISSGAADLAAAQAMLALFGDDAAEAARLLGEARAGGSDLVAALPELRAWEAAERDDWGAAARALEEVADPGNATLEAARALAWLEHALERLGRGDAGGAREGLGKAKALQRHLVADDQATLEFAQLALGVIGTDRPEAAARNLAQTLASARFQTAAQARTRDLGQGFVAYAWLKANRADEAGRALDRVKDRRLLGGAWEVLKRATTDADARRLFAAGNHGEAERLWRSLDGDTAAQHNAAVASYASGRRDEAERALRTLADAGQPPEALYNLALALARRGEHAGAQSAFRRYLAAGGQASRDDAERRAQALEKLFGLTPGGGR
jgi:tetratricopeptide (TPR) repeat protein